MARIPIAKIRTDGGTQSRETLSDDVIAEYTEVYWRHGSSMPPVVVFHDGSDYWLADGFHRVRAATAAGKPSIRADVRQGTQRDAILFSVGANSSHGLRRTHADKRHAVLMLLRDDEWAHRSSRWIADMCGVSDPLVGRLRSSSDGGHRLGHDGKLRKLPGKPTAPLTSPPAETGAPLATVIELHADDAPSPPIDAQDSRDPDQVSLLSEFAHHAQRLIRAWRWDREWLISELETWVKRAREMLDEQERSTGHR